jgi:cation diffusion facilitator family transporter
MALARRVGTARIAAVTGSSSPSGPGKNAHAAEAAAPAGEDGKSVTIGIALTANLIIATAKVAGGLVTMSAALLSEAAHSAADVLNEVFLLAALRSSRRPPDARHPFGYGKERFFWSLLAAVGIFVMGGCFSFYPGLHTLLGSGSGHERFGVALGVLAVSLCAEGTSLTRATVQVRRDGRRQRARPDRRAASRHRPGSTHGVRRRRLRCPRRCRSPPSA